MVNRVIDGIRLKFPPDKNWRLMTQHDPPKFGWAHLVDRETLSKEVARRRPNCADIINQSAKYCSFKKGMVSIVILTCRRWKTLETLIDSMEIYFESVKDYPLVEKILVDNGSGIETIDKARKKRFFDKIITHPVNVGLVNALKNAYRKADGEYIIFIEDDFILDTKKQFIKKCVDVFEQFPEIGIIRLKDQNNWWKPYRVISPLRKTDNGVEFWTWLPSKNGMLNVWCAGSVIFRKVSYFSTGELPDVKENIDRSKKMHQGYVYECVYGKEYNKYWLAAKMKDSYPFFQPNANEECLGWGS
ncbi:MAG: glycosyltransferase family 2 protein [Candidatus Omnitrophica bacterium]|nr:glycosyltransferase family 2 protein [Candidatus Omnitrophota bacterium]